MNDNVLNTIPGEIVGSAGQSLPSTESTTETTRRMIVRLPDGARAEVTFVKKTSSKGRTTRCFWTAVSAVILEE